jgi:hypothetical protein
MPFVETLTAVGIAAPALNALSGVISALKEPMGKKKVEEMRHELTLALEEIQVVVQAHDVRIQQLQAQIDFMRLPFWKRWFRPIPGGRRGLPG